MRINKFLSSAGIVSRRGADQWIADGRVKINGQLAELGSKVESGDQVEVDGKLVEQEEQLVYIALNKPVGITSTTERHIEGNVVDFVNHPLRIFHIGRLDKDSDGLLLLTNDGDIVNEILREEHGHEKEYIVTVDSPLTASFISQMEKGVKILDTVTKPCTVTKLGPKTFSIILTQGLNRQIRRMCAALGYHIRRLQRVRILTIELGDLPIGEWRELTDAERNKLFKTLHYKPKR
ncbi:MULTISPECIES: pseudouridine synthase [Sporosarcina]|uniref:Pseudouridine synthase n=1 Tax=Sporosarcina ureae TaxID=1571 RepID=A0ABM6JWU8_SPOUR|nr:MULTISPECIES: pseudouridine synthase [Sporosarcina]ARF14448.1 23S rRNA pseudouridine synthase F [Sporosarcina ureae]PIC58248.1 23S rRNA pseudouridine synthase F [Sporosarcina sp. P10]PIC61752.1 23S rRNA pseudouridine synthase F [Sporosarcina sp. P12(2017)]PIC77396.1 23S rRNA pseudouridine synthase F [Sporosarcina sp. P19]